MKRKPKATVETNKGASGTRRKQDAQQPSYLASLITNISDALISTDLEFHIVQWNLAAENMYGWTAAEVTGHSLVDFVQTEYVGITREEIIRTVLEKGIWKGEVTHKCKDGTRIPVMASVSLVRDGECQPAGFITINRNITEQKRAEEALKESEERFSTAFFTSPVSQSIITQGTNEIIAINDACCRLFGYSREELIGANTAKLSLWEDPVDRMAAVEELQRTGHLSPREATIRMKSGEIRAVILAIEPISWKGLPCLISSVFDITDRKQAEEALRESEFKFRSLYESLIELSAIHEIVYDSTRKAVDYRILDCNPAFEKITGIQRQQAIGALASQLYETSQPPYFDIYLKVAETGEPTSFETEFAPMGKTFNISVFSPQRGRFVTVAADITERKQAEDKLRESEERLRLSLHAANQGFYDLNVQTGNAIVNNEYAEMLGYDPQTFVETNAAWIERLHPDDREATAKAYSDYTNGLLPEYRVEFRQRMKDGNWKWILSLGKVIEYDAEGKPLRMLGTHTDITERKRAEDTIKLSEARYRSLVETQADVVARSDTSGILTFANDSYCQVFGLSREQAIGMDFTSTVLPEDLPTILETREALYNPPYRKYIETRNVTPRGVRWFGWDNSAVRDEKGNIIEFQGVGHDITERKQAEERIKTQLERLASLRAIDTAIISSTNLSMTFYILLSQAITRLKIDAASILLFDPVTNELEVCARQGFYSSDSKHVRVRMGKDIAGRCALEQTPLEDHFLTKEDFASLAPSLREEGFTCYVAMPLINKAKILGVLEVFERKHHPHDQDWLDFLNALVGQAAIAIDNFQLFDGLQRSNTMLERRVAERTQELHQTNAELERANRAKDEFLATMSHELRTPLNSILGLSESLLEQKRGPLNEPQQKSLQIIESSGRHLLELINDILDLSKIDAGKFDIYPQTIEVDELCQSALAFVRQQAVQKSINLTYEEDQAIAEFQADPRRMKQILVNLLTNAVKFTPQGGRVTLQVHAYAEHNLIQFSVIDNGIGIAQKDLKQLFQPFMQVDSSLNRQFEGTGLGLTLVHKLTDLQGGSVEVESEVNQGSRFTVNLPWQKDIADKEQAADSDATHPVTRVEGKSVSSSGETSNRRAILLAEDNMANTLTLSEYLESHGYKVVFARDGWEAISKTEETNPDLILMDIQMPSLDGLEATRRLRADPRFAKTPIIALTALAMSGDRERCLEAGANEYMSKPVSLKMLVKTIKAMLESGGDISQ